MEKSLCHLVRLDVLNRLVSRDEKQTLVVASGGSAARIDLGSEHMC